MWGPCRPASPESPTLAHRPGPTRLSGQNFLPRSRTSPPKMAKGNLLSGSPPGIGRDPAARRKTSVNEPRTPSSSRSTQGGGRATSTSARLAGSPSRSPSRPHWAPQCARHSGFGGHGSSLAASPSEAKDTLRLRARCTNAPTGRQRPWPTPPFFKFILTGGYVY